MDRLLLTPPLAFAAYFIAVVILSWVCSRLSFRKPNKDTGSQKSYACGEDVDNHMAQPDYSAFFHFAFFFTLAHVAAMIIALVPVETVKTLDTALLYIVGAAAGFTIVLRK